MTVKVGVIGTGMIGQDHIRRLTQVLTGNQVVAVSDINKEQAEKVAGAIGAKAYTDGVALINDSDVDAVVVTSWGPTHEEYVLAAIAAGKPVFCEKPLATTQEACFRIIDAEVKRGKRLVQVGFMRRFDTAYRQMKAVVESGKIGAPLIFKSVHRNPSVPQSYTSDMAIVDTAVHDIDTARWLLGEEVKAVSVIAARRNSRGGELRDPIIVLMEMESGAVVDIEVSVNIDYAYDIGGEISGETGVVTLSERNGITVKSAGAFHGKVTADWKERFIEAFDIEFKEWLAAAGKGTAIGPSAWDGYAAAVATDAGVEAARTGTRVKVEMTDKPALYA
ncbi:Gfo/Idh/MocA family protein [Ensifer aridi]|uniref:Gfo/Idh/MocA family protein n=1 Tax=Ensifer aridi TaxID=1708715 RepID=UPI0009BD5520|nr:Gfo/Idh/MocA family oxidoreductase [Ensifer aridi]